MHIPVKLARCMFESSIVVLKNTHFKFNNGIIALVMPNLTLCGRAGTIMAPILVGLT